MAKRSKKAKAVSAATKSMAGGEGSEDTGRALRLARERLKQVERLRKELDLNIKKLDKAIELVIHVPHIGGTPPPKMHRPATKKK